MKNTKSPSFVIENIREAKGTIRVLVFHEEQYYMDAEKAILQYSINVKNTGNLTQNMEDLAPGFYAFTCFHDRNNNGKLDKNILGIPTEPYGFSNKVRPKFRAASWEEAKVYIDQNTVVNISIDVW